MTVSAPSLRKLELAAQFLEQGNADADFQKMAARAIRRAVAEARMTTKPAGLTKRQHEALVFIDGYIREHHIAPTFTEITEALGIKSKSGVYLLVQSLQERGWIEAIPSRARSIRVLVSPAKGDAHVAA